MKIRMTNACIVIIVSLGLLLSIAESRGHKGGHKGGHRGVHSDRRERTYHGVIHADAPEDTEVQLDQPLTAYNRKHLDGDEICGYTIYKLDTDVPFRVDVSDKKTGLARLLLAPGYKLDAVRQFMYKFQVAPHDCVTGKHARRDWVHISVEPASHPVEQTMRVEVSEGRLYDEIVRLEKPEDSQFPCLYELLTTNIPFVIDNSGIIRNTEPLNFKIAANYLLEVSVSQCGGSRSSEKVIIDVVIKEMCKPGWKGLLENIDYSPVSGVKLIGEKAVLETCDATCPEPNLAAHVQLETKHIGKGCDRDTYSIQSQRKLCGAAAASVDLLPSPALSPLTKDLPTDDGKESDQIFYFDGHSAAVEVPEERINHSLSEHFTVMTWLKHEPNKDHAKEQIICSSDDKNMNRHHYSLFIHNCKLVLLLRKEPGPGVDPDVFKPAEWRWHLPQICDSQWHHYAVNVDLPQVRLHVDGNIFVEDEKNPEVVDDWPLHPTSRVNSTKLVVGACWLGSSQQLGQHLHGYMAGLSVLRGQTESDRVIQCLNNCKEKLDFHAMNELDTGMSLAFNSEMTEMTINGHNHTEIERLLRHVGYVNYRLFPTPGHRTISIQTDLTCGTSPKVDIPVAEVSVMVLQPETPVITVQGSTLLTLTQDQLYYGHHIMGDVRITSRTKQEAKELDQLVDADKQQDAATDATDVVDKDKYQLDSCMLRPDTHMDPTIETLDYPSHLIANLGLAASLTPAGLMITGVDKVYNYEHVLQNVQYLNHHPEKFVSRTFILTCSELNGRFVSNELHIQINVIHEDPHAAVPPKPAHLVVNKQESFNLAQSVVESNFVQNKAANNGVGMAVIVVVCVGFLGFLIVLGVLRIRAAHKRTQVVQVDERQEMEWDNSALNITVNPLEQQMTYEDEHDTKAESDSESDASSYREEESSEEEEEGPAVATPKAHELEWDDATLPY